MSIDEIWRLLRQGLAAESPEQATDCFHQALGVDADSAAAQSGMEWASRWLAEGRRPPPPEGLAQLAPPAGGPPPATDEAAPTEPSGMTPQPAKTVSEAPFQQPNIGAPVPEGSPSLEAPVIENAPPPAEAVPDIPEAPHIVAASSDLLLQQGLDEIKAERFATAAETLRQALSIQPDLAEARERLALALFRLGNKEDALEVYQDLARLAPDRVEAHANQGFILEDLGRYQEAVEAFNRALVISPDLAEAQMGLAESLQALRRWAEAATAWEKAVSLRPDLSEFSISLAEAYVALGRPDDAANTLRHSLERLPTDTALHLKLGHTLLESQRFEEAAQQFQTLLSMNPGLEEAREGLAKAQAMPGFGPRAPLIRRFVAFAAIDGPLSIALPYLVYVDLVIAGGGTVFGKMPLTDTRVVLALALYLWTIRGAQLLLPLVVPLIYFTLCHGLRGQTLGKRLFGIKVVRAERHSPGLVGALVRTAVMFILSPLLITWWPVPFTRRALHDYAAGTRVVEAPRSRSR